MGLRATMASKLRRMRSATSLRLKAAASAKLAAANCRLWGPGRGGGKMQQQQQQQQHAVVCRLGEITTQSRCIPQSAATHSCACPLARLTGCAGPARAEPGVRASAPRPRAEAVGRACSALDAEGGLQCNKRQCWRSRVQHMRAWLSRHTPARPTHPQHAPGGWGPKAVLVNACRSPVAKQRARAQGVGPLGPHLELRQLGSATAAAAAGRRLVGRSHRPLGIAAEVQAVLGRGATRSQPCGEEPLHFK